MTPGRPRISLIIPAFNEEKYLPRLLDSVEAARSRWEGPREEIEVIVADNASTDGTAALASARGCRVIRVEKRAIAASRNGGARASAGEIVAFVDADMSIHPETFKGIAEILSSPKWIAGATGVWPERWSIGIAATFAGMMPLLWLTRFDTGVVFMRRSDFDAVGGYDERLLYAEDVVILWRLRQLGRRRKARLIRARHLKAVVSMRKFDKFGDWHYLGFIWKASGLLMSAKKRQAFADEYWYKPER